MQWEYDILRIMSEGTNYIKEHPNATDYVVPNYDSFNNNLKKSIQNLNLWGAEGWEIAGVSSDERGDGYIYLKRPKASTN